MIRLYLSPSRVCIGRGQETATNVHASVWLWPLAILTTVITVVTVVIME